MPDDPLLDQFLKREPAALTRIESIVKSIVRFRGYGIPEAERAELAQESLLQLWRETRAESFAFREDFGSFARKVALRRCLSWRRARRLETPLQPHHDGISDGAAGADELAERRQLAARILGGLRSACRELVTLHIYEERSYAELAIRLGRSEAALRTAVWQCLKEARESLRRLGYRPRGGPRAWNVR